MVQLNNRDYSSAMMIGGEYADIDEWVRILKQRAKICPIDLTLWLCPERSLWFLLKRNKCGRFGLVDVVARS
jgi:hypothetical protein